MSDVARDKKEEIIKSKINTEDAKDVDLSKIPDEDIDKLLTAEDKEEYIKAKADTPDLKLDNLSDEQVDSLLSKIEVDENSSSLHESEKELIEALSKEEHFKLDEAERVYRDYLNSKESFIDYMYEKLEELGDDVYNIDVTSIMKDLDLTVTEAGECDPQEELADQTGEKLGNKPDLPEMEYANMKDAKSTSDLEIISDHKDE